MHGRFHALSTRTQKHTTIVRKVAKPRWNDEAHAVVAVLISTRPYTQNTSMNRRKPFYNRQGSLELQEKRTKHTTSSHTDSVAVVVSAGAFRLRRAQIHVCSTSWPTTPPAQLCGYGPFTMLLRRTSCLGRACSARDSGLWIHGLVSQDGAQYIYLKLRCLQFRVA